MKRKRRKKSKVDLHPSEIRHTTVTLNPIYCNMSPVRLESLLPPLPDDAFMRGYCGWQQQRDSGDIFIFFRTRWIGNRQGLHIHRYLASPPSFYSPVVFGMTHESELARFDEQLGYDVRWSDILEIGWDSFSELVSLMLSESLTGLLNTPNVAGSDNITCSGDMGWIPLPYREAIRHIGETQKV